MGLGCALIFGCAPLEPAPSPSPVSGQPDAGTPDDCARACARLRELHCPEGDPTLGPDGKPATGDESTCEATCIDVEQSGYTTLNSRCVEKIGTCADLERCGWSAE